MSSLAEKPEPTLAPTNPLKPSNPRRRAARLALGEVLPRLFGLLVLLAAAVGGWQLRAFTFDATSEVRFRGDVQNALNQGNAVLRTAGLKPEQGTYAPFPDVFRAWVDRYDRVYANARGSGRYSLDYAPLRLLVMTLWVRDVWHDHGDVRNYSDNLMSPLMRLNNVVGLASAAGMFLLVRSLARRSPTLRLRDAYPDWRSLPRDAWHRHRPWTLGAVAAGLTYLNPAAIINAHAFPQWDTWLLPFFLFACWLGLKNHWTTAGLLIVLGAMLKGQLLIACPVLVAWSLFTTRWGGGALRFALGAVIAVVVVTWPWLLRSGEVLPWLAATAAGLSALACARWLLTSRTRRVSPDGPGPAVKGSRTVPIVLLLLAFVAFAAAGGWPALFVPNNVALPAWWPWALLGCLGVAAALATPRRLPHLLLAVVAVGVLLGAWRFHGSWTWYEIGFEFPTDNYQALAMGPTANLPAILEQRFGWGLKDAVTFHPHLTLQTLLRLVYGLLLVPVLAATVLHARRRDVRLLVCLAAPWAIFFAILPQMHERYLVWAAVVSAATIALGFRFFLLHLATTFFAFSMIALQILHQNPGWWPRAFAFFVPMIPDAGWATLLLALVWLCACWGGRAEVRGARAE